MFIAILMVKKLQEATGTYIVKNMEDFVKNLNQVIGTRYEAILKMINSQKN